jgi:D-aspartate ligase
MITSPDLDTTVPVLILKSHRSSFHHGALGIARNLGRLGVSVYAMVDDRYAPLALSRYLTSAFVWESRGLDTGRLLNTTATLPRPTILIPIDDTAAFFIAEHAKELKRSFLFPDLPRELPRQLGNKMSLYQLSKRFGIPCPEQAFPKSIEDVHEFIGRATFPVVVKSVEQWRPEDGVPRTLIVESPEELLAIYRKVQTRQSPNIAFQEYIPGDDWIFHGYCNPDSNCFLPFTGRKLRSYPASAGTTSLGVSTINERLVSQTRSFLNAIAYSGIMDIDYRFDKRDGKYKLVDFNPRVGLNFRIFDDHAGINVVRALHLDLTGRSIRRTPMVEGRLLIVESMDPVACFNYLRRGDLTVRALWSSFIGSREFAWFSRDDPLPFLSMCIRLLLHIPTRAIQQLRWLRRIAN